VQQAIAYSDVIQPILQARCYSCHGPQKQKGKLRMDDSLRLMKGGKDGPVIVPGNEAKSELIKRISLPKDDDDHMPPSGKTQLNAQDLALIHWWVATGATFNSPVGALPQSAEIRATLSDLEKVPVVIQRAPIIPTVSVIAADPAAIEKLKAKGVIIQPVAQHTNFLLADFVMANVTDRDLALLLPLKDQLIELRLGNTSIGDGGLAFVGQLQQLWRLELQHTRITDKGLAEIKKLAELRYLNLVGTSISADGLLSLAGLSHLQSIYLYQTSVKRVDWQRLKKQFSKTNIDTGGYSVPLFPTDTMEIKPPPAIK
ncbi:MAG TPA: c-type cytochrome domain-containing protein, partial [Chitinophagaceae bacterium]